MIQTAAIDPAFEGLTPRSDRARIEADLAAFLAGTRRRYAAGPNLGPLYDRVARCVLRGGKRLRPRLALAAYRIASGRDDPPRPVWLAAASLELFHAFMLVHDDLIDGSLSRRGEPTLHEAIRLDGDRPDDVAGRKRACDLGLVAGDLLYALGTRLLARAGLDDRATPKAHRIVADMLLETGFGEALDVLYDDVPLDALDETQILDAYLRKTARYSVSGPLVLGSALAGAPAGVTRALRRFGDLLGLGYQFHNDLEPLSRAPEDGEQSDLDTGKRTWVLWVCHRLLDEHGRRALGDALASPPGLDRRRRLWGLVHESGAVATCRARLDGLARESVAVLRRAPLDPRQRRAFEAILHLIPGRITPGIHEDGPSTSVAEDPRDFDALEPPNPAPPICRR